MVPDVELGLVLSPMLGPVPVPTPSPSPMPD